MIKKLLQNYSVLVEIFQKTFTFPKIKLFVLMEKLFFRLYRPLHMIVD